LHLHREQKADDWLCSKAVEMQMYQDKQGGIPHFKAIPKHEGIQKGYVTRYVPITHHLLPAITATERTCKSKDAWTDNAMTTSLLHAETCERPGTYTIASLDECDSHCVTTDILGDGNLHMVIQKVHLPEDNKTESQPMQKRCPGGVCFEEYCSISAMYKRRIRHRTSPGQIWCSVGPDARNLPIISDGLWETRATHTPTQTRMRKGKFAVEPQSKGLVIKNLNKIMTQTFFEELALRPKTPLPHEDLNLPESDEDKADVTKVSGFNLWQLQVNVATSASPFA
jgi:hypothetical protein